MAQGAGGLDGVRGLRLGPDLASGEAGKVDRRQLHAFLQGVHKFPDLLCEGDSPGSLVRWRPAQAAEVRGRGFQPGVRSPPGKKYRGDL